MFLLVWLPHLFIHQCLCCCSSLCLFLPNLGVHTLTDDSRQFAHKQVRQLKKEKKNSDWPFWQWSNCQISDMIWIQSRTTKKSKKSDLTAINHNKHLNILLDRKCVCCISQINDTISFHSSCVIVYCQTKTLPAFSVVFYCVSAMHRFCFF